MWWSKEVQCFPLDRSLNIKQHEYKKYEHFKFVLKEKQLLKEDTEHILLTNEKLNS